jgi:hypothetical protein
MSSYGMYSLVALVTTDVSEERFASIFKVTRIIEFVAAYYGWYLLLTCSYFVVYFYPKDGGDTFLRNAGPYKSYRATDPRRRHSS